MNKSRKYLFYSGLLMTLLLGSACGGASAATAATILEPTTEATQIIEPTSEPAVETESPEIAQAETPTPDEAAQATEESGVSNSASGSQKLLAWIGQGGQPSADSTGQLVLVEADGSFGPLLQAPADTRRIMACGNEATSPDGQMFAFYMGGADAGKLYMMSGANVPLEVDDVQAVTCLGNGTFQYAPSGERFAYLAYPADWNSKEYGSGRLHVVNTGTLEDELSVDNVGAFDITDNGVAYVAFFTNDRGEVDEAAVNWWDGSAERELASVLPEGEDCKFTSGEIGVAPDSNFIMVLGHRCRTGETGTRWQFYTVDVAEQNVSMAASDAQPGAFLPFARTNNIYFSSDGATAFYTVPDGVTANTVALAAMDMGSMTPRIVIERQAVMPTYSGSPNASPVVSPDGRWVAVVVTSPNNDNMLQVVNIADPSVAPITYNATSRGDLISGMAFSADSSHLFFVVGSESTNRDGDNSLFSLELASGTTSRIARGLFGPAILVSPDNAQLAITDTQVPDDNNEPIYSNLLLLTTDGAKTTLIEGGEIQDGKVTNQQFIYPLAWRPAE